MVAKAEENYGQFGPFPSVLSIYLMTAKAGKCPHMLGWIFDLVYDGFRAQNIIRENLGAKSLQVKGRVDDLDVIACKRSLHLRLLGDELGKLNFAPAVKQSMRDCYKSVKTYRSKHGFPDNMFAKHTQKPDLSFKQPWSRAENFYDNFMLNLIFNKFYDSTLNSALS